MSIIPKEQLGGFQRWQINSFDKKPVAATAPQLTDAPPVIEEAVVTTEDSVNEMSLPTAEDIERIYEEARKTGYDAGYEEGKANASKESAALVEKAMTDVGVLLNNMETALGELDQSVAHQVLELALEVARQMTGGTIKTQTDYLLPIIKESITSLPLHHAHIVLHLNPIDAALVRSGMGEQLTQNNLQIQENSDITPGGCRLTAGTSEVDASIETRWTRVLEAIGAEPQAWLSPK